MFTYDSRVLVDKKTDKNGNIISASYREDAFYSKAEIENLHYSPYEDALNIEVIEFAGIVKFCRFWTEISEYNDRNDLIKQTTVNANNDVIDERTFVYKYDSLGNITRKESHFNNKLFSDHAEEYAYEYNDAGQLTKKWQLKGGSRYIEMEIEYKDGLKHKQTLYWVTDSKPFKSEINETTEYTYDNGHLAEEKILCGNGEISKFYVYSYADGVLSKELFSPQKGAHKWSYHYDSCYMPRGDILTPDMLYEILDYHLTKYPDLKSVYIDELEVDRWLHHQHNQIVIKYFEKNYGIYVLYTW